MSFFLKYMADNTCSSIAPVIFLIRWIKIKKLTGTDFSQQKAIKSQRFLENRMARTKIIN